MFAIATTTINGWTPDLNAWYERCDHDVRMYVATDRKTPMMESRPFAHIIDLSEQRDRFPGLHWHLPENHYARKNFAYAAAIADNAKKIFETDDDNAPTNETGDVFAEALPNLQVVPIQLTGWVNVFAGMYEKPIWPRGFPLTLAQRTMRPPLIESGRSLLEKPTVISLGCDDDPDVDAVQRIVLAGRKTKLRPASTSIQLREGQLCPFNSQHTLWLPEAYPWMLLPPSKMHRQSDIVRGVWAQTQGKKRVRLAWTTARRVKQVRNQHNLVADLREEVDMYEGTYEPLIADQYRTALVQAWRSIVYQGDRP